MGKDMEQTLAEIIREQVARKGGVRIPGLGLFKYEHVPQHQRQYDNGQVVMMPPKDTLAFIPEQSEGEQQ